MADEKRIRIRTRVKSESKWWLISALIGGGLGLVIFGYLGWRVTSPKYPPVVSTHEKFNVPPGRLGNQEYRVSIQRSTYGKEGRRIRPIQEFECHDFLVIDFKYPIKNSEVLLTELKKLKGVVDVRDTPYRLIIDRPCIVADDVQSLWSWKEIWQGAELTLAAHHK